MGYSMLDGDQNKPAGQPGIENVGKSRTAAAGCGLPGRDSASSGARGPGEVRIIPRLQLQAAPPGLFGRACTAVSPHDGDHSRWIGGKLAARAPHAQASVRDVGLCCTVVQEGLPSAEFAVKFWCSYGPCRFL
jgi:hypothetical protein